MDVNQLAEATEGADSQSKLIAPRDHSRDPAQLWTDDKVLTLVKEWQEAGQPEPSDTAPFRRLAVKKDDRPELRRMINRAFTLASSGDNTDVIPAFYLDGKTPDGKVAVKFNVRIKPEKAEDETPDPNAEQSGDAADQSGDAAEQPTRGRRHAE